MRKANKIMMITVSVLLSAVLLTTSALSGTLAKYTTSATAHSESARVAKWGVTVEATPDPNLVAIATNGDQYNENSVAFTFENIELAPGDSYPHAMHFEIGGKPEVSLMIKIIIDVSYSATKDTGELWINNGTAGVNKSDDTGDSYLPIGFYLGVPDMSGKYEKPTTILAPYYTGVHYNAEISMQKAICNVVDLNCNSETLSTSKKLGYVYKTFAPNKDVVLHPAKGSYNTKQKKTVHSEVNENVDITEFDLGFYWPATWPEGGSSSNINYDELSMFLNQNRNPTITAKFTVVIEQIQ